VTRVGSDGESASSFRGTGRPCATASRWKGLLGRVVQMQFSNPCEPAAVCTSVQAAAEHAFPRSKEGHATGISAGKVHRMRTVCPPCTSLAARSDIYQQHVPPAACDPAALFRCIVLFRGKQSVVCLLTVKCANYTVAHLPGHPCPCAVLRAECTSNSAPGMCIRTGQLFGGGGGRGLAICHSVTDGE